MSMLELEAVTGSTANRRLAEVNVHLAKELNAARERLASRYEGQDEVEELRQRISGLEEDVARRDEQVEFLMQVHDASKDVEWVSTWNCPSCTMKNQPHAEKCEACGSAKAAAEAAAVDTHKDFPFRSELTQMGFPANKARKAVSETNAVGAEAAAEWLFAHLDQPDSFFDFPILD